MPTLDEVEVHVQPDTPVTLYLGGEEEQTGGSTPTPPTPPEFAIDPNHAWWAAGYQGTGPLTDTGSTGGLDLTQDETSDPWTLVNDMLTPTGSSWLVTEEAAGGPSFGTGDFTVLWVGREDAVWSDRSTYFATDWWGCGGVGMQRETEPYGKKIWTYDAGCELLGPYTSTVAAIDPAEIVYVGISRVGDSFTFVSPGVEADTMVLDAGPDLSATSVYMGEAALSGAAVWLGQALTEEQIAQAAEELGYIPPPMTQSANHLWNVAEYSGTGDLLDTGTTGGIDLDTTGATFSDQTLKAGGDNTALSNLEISPAFGTADFSVLWVGDLVLDELNDTSFVLSSGDFNSTGGTFSIGLVSPISATVGPLAYNATVQQVIDALALVVGDVVTSTTPNDQLLESYSAVHFTWPSLTYDWVFTALESDLVQPNGPGLFSATLVISRLYGNFFDNLWNGPCGYVSIWRYEGSVAGYAADEGDPNVVEAWIAGNGELPEGMNWFAITRSGSTLTLYSSENGSWTEEIPEDMGTLTGDSTYLGYQGIDATAGAAVWLGQALTEEQLAQAATELGYSDPA